MVLENLKPKQERTPNFIDVVKLNTPMTILEATEFLASFHKTTTQNVLNADNFFNLKNLPEGAEKIIFQKSVNNGTPCLIMRFLGSTEKVIPVYNILMNKYTGQPMQHVA